MLYFASQTLWALNKRRDSDLTKSYGEGQKIQPQPLPRRTLPVTRLRNWYIVQLSADKFSIILHCGHISCVCCIVSTDHDKYIGKHLLVSNGYPGPVPPQSNDDTDLFTGFRRR